MTLDDTIAEIAAQSIPGKAAEMAAYHKVDRPYLGTPTPAIEALCKTWRADLELGDRLTLAAGLWDSNIFEGRIAAAKLLTQARIRPDDAAAWDLICDWVADLDTWAIADLVGVAAQKRLVADPSRLDRVEEWTTSELMWERRSALIATLPFALLNHPKPAEAEARERALGWAASYLADKDWFIQKTIAGWLRDLSKHEPARVEAFLAEFGDLMKPWAHKEAGQLLG